MRITELKSRARQVGNMRRRVRRALSVEQSARREYDSIVLRNDVLTERCACLENDLAAARKALSFLGFLARPFVSFFRLFA